MQREKERVIDFICQFKKERKKKKEKSGRYIFFFSYLLCSHTFFGKSFSPELSVYIHVPLPYRAKYHNTAIYGP